MQSTIASRRAVDRDVLTTSLSDRIQGSGMKLHQEKFRWDIRERFFTERVISHRLPGR